MEASASDRASHAAIALALVLAVFALYAPVLDHELTLWDDDVFVHQNPWLEPGLSAEGVRWAFERRRAANWFPLTRLSFLADRELHGLSPRGVHATNVLLHAASGVLLLGALRRLGIGLGPAAFVAAVFALHPLHVESVAWITALNAPLFGLFALWSLYAFVRWRQGGSRGAPVAAASKRARTRLKCGSKGASTACW